MASRYLPKPRAQTTISANAGGRFFAITSRTSIGRVLAHYEICDHNLLVPIHPAFCVAKACLGIQQIPNDRIGEFCQGLMAERKVIRKKTNIVEREGQPDIALGKAQEYAPSV